MITFVVLSLMTLTFTYAALDGESKVVRILAHTIETIFFGFMGTMLILMLASIITRL